MLLCEATNKRPELIERHGVERQQLEQVDLKAARGGCRLAALWRSLGGGALWSIRVVCRCRVLRLHRHLNEVRRVNIVHRLTDARGCGEAVVQGVGTAHLQRDRDARERNAQQLARQLAHLERCGTLVFPADLEVRAIPRAVGRPDAVSHARRELGCGRHICYGVTPYICRCWRRLPLPAKRAHKIELPRRLVRVLRCEIIQLDVQPRVERH